MKNPVKNLSLLYVAGYSILLILIATFSSCNNTTTIMATAISGAKQDFADKVIGTYSVDVVLQCGDTTKAWIRSDKRFAVCAGKTVTMEDNGISKKPYIVAIR
jgi:hypothetical protein